MSNDVFAGRKPIAALTECAALLALAAVLTSMIMLGSAGKRAISKPTPLHQQPQAPGNPVPPAPPTGKCLRVLPLIISFCLGVMASLLAVGVIDMFFMIPSLEPPQADRTDPFSLPFGIKNGATFFTMDDTCAVAIVEDVEYKPPVAFVTDVISRKLDDIRAGDHNLLYLKPTFSAPDTSRPIKATIRFGVKYKMLWQHSSDLGTCQWYFATNGAPEWECVESKNVRYAYGNTPILRVLPSGKLGALTLAPDDSKLLESALKACR